MFINDEIVGRSGSGNSTLRCLRVKRYDDSYDVHIGMGFGGSERNKIVGAFTPWQARDLAECLLVAADLAESAERAQG